MAYLPKSGGADHGSSQVLSYRFVLDFERKRLQQARQSTSRIADASPTFERGDGGEDGGDVPVRIRRSSVVRGWDFPFSLFLPSP